MTDEGTLSLIEAAETAVRAAVTAQRESTDPAHEEFYAWGGALSDMLRRLEHLCTVLDRQVENYEKRRVLRDDEGINPHVRLTEMRSWLEGIRVDLRGAGTSADRFHNAASHIAVEVDPDGEGSTL